MQTMWPTDALSMDERLDVFSADTTVIASRARSDSVNERDPVNQIELGLPAIESWECWVRGLAVLVDVRDAQDRASRQAIPDALQIPWRHYLSYQINPYFIAELQHLLTPDRMVIMVCNTGWCSREAAQAARRSGFNQVFYVCDGLSGDGFPTR